MLVLPSPANGWTRGCTTAASRATWNGAFRCPTTSRDGKLKGKVFYVWFDAPIEYIGATKEWADANGKGDGAWRDWWFGDARQGRAPISNSWARTTCRSTPWAFPVTIMGSGEPWKLVDRLKGFN